MKKNETSTSDNTGSPQGLQPMNNHHDIVYVLPEKITKHITTGFGVAEWDASYSEWGGHTGVEPLKDVFVFTKEQLDKRDKENNEAIAWLNLIIEKTESCNEDIVISDIRDSVKRALSHLKK